MIKKILIILPASTCVPNSRIRLNLTSVLKMVSKALIPDQIRLDHIKFGTLSARSVIKNS